MRKHLSNMARIFKRFTDNQKPNTQIPLTNPWEENDNRIPSTSTLNSDTLRKNMLLPLVSAPIPKQKSYLEFWKQSIKRLIMNEPNAVTPEHKPKRIVIIGVHGWFPNKLFSRIIGEPVGTSSYFASKMHSSLLNYCNINNIDLTNTSIDVIALEGEGMVQERLELLYKQLIDSDDKNKQKLKDADLVIFSAHSQGVPVSSLILSRLITEGIVDPKKQVTGILAMAGISHGPFPQLKSSIIVKYVESDPARQLFEFNDDKTKVSKDYLDALKHVLDSGTRIAAIGSWYDQVVPLYSATMQGVSSPNIYRFYSIIYDRALYIDGADYQPDFLSHLIVFALNLRNHGLNDYGLLIQISDLLAGSIYGFGTQGHSALYEEEKTYHLGIGWILAKYQYWGNNSTKSLLMPFKAPSKTNPYFLPWIMAKLTCDQGIQSNMAINREFQVVLQLFKDWSPSLGHLKEFKYRLEPLKSKL